MYAAMEPDVWTTLRNGYRRLTSSLGHDRRDDRELHSRAGGYEKKMKERAYAVPTIHIGERPDCHGCLFAFCKVGMGRSRYRIRLHSDGWRTLMLT